jgi:hypothetical protein
LLSTRRRHQHGSTDRTGLEAEACAGHRHLPGGRGASYLQRGLGALPIEGETYHAKWAGRELYTLVPPFPVGPGEENATVTPIPGDVVYFDVSPDTIDLPLAQRQQYPKGLVDLAVFYGRNNLLLGPAGFMPGNLFAVITEGLVDYAKACNELFREGMMNERFIIRRLD